MVRTISGLEVTLYSSTLSDLRSTPNPSNPSQRFGFTQASSKKLRSYQKGNFSSDGSFYALGEGTNLRIWDLRKSNIPMQQLPVGGQEIHDVNFESDGRTIAFLESKQLSWFTYL